MPAHALLELLNLRKRRPRHHDEGDVAFRQMDDRAVEVIGKQRAALAAFFPVGTEHEMVDDQLAFAAEQVGQSLFAVWAVEHIIFLDLFPGQLATLAA